jgi:hypothetical protein
MSSVINRDDHFLLVVLIALNVVGTYNLALNYM